MADEFSSEDLNRFRSYLMLLVRMNMARQARNKLDPSDIVQQTLLDAVRRQGQCRAETEPERAAWLRKILACNMADAFRAAHRAKRDIDMERSLENDLAQSASRIQDWLAASQSSPSQQVGFKEQCTRLGEALLTLPVKQRQVVEMKYLQGLSVAEVAASLNHTEAAVGGLLRRGLAKLRELLDEGT